MTPEGEGMWAMTADRLARLYDVPTEMCREPITRASIERMDSGVLRMLADTYGSAVAQGVDVNAPGSAWPALIGALYGIGIYVAPPAQPERPMDGKSDQELTDYRLTHELCVWCGRRLGDRDDLFCQQDCQTEWHAAQNGEPGWSRPENAPQELLTASPPGEVPQDVAVEPWFRPMNRPPRADPTVWLTNSTAPARILQGQQDPVMRTELDQALRQRPGALAAAPEVASGEGVSLGYSVIPGSAALRSISPEPQFDTYPHEPVAAMCSQTERPWQRAQIQRHCAECNALTLPYAAERRQFVARETYRPGAPAQSEMIWNDGVTVTRIRCSVCDTVYPGPTVVALRRPWSASGRGGAQGDDGWEYAAVSYGGSATGVATREALSRGAVEGMVWDGCYQQVVQGLLPTCHSRGCEGRAQQWWLVSGALRMDHCLWVPRDGDPLRVGLCTRHSYLLRVGLMREVEYVSRIEHGLSPDVMIIR